MNCSHNWICAISAQSQTMDCSARIIQIRSWSPMQRPRKRNQRIQGPIVSLRKMRGRRVETGGLPNGLGNQKLRNVRNQSRVRIYYQVPFMTFATKSMQLHVEPTHHPLNVSSCHPRIIVTISVLQYKTPYLLAQTLRQHIPMTLREFGLMHAFGWVCLIASKAAPSFNDRQ